MNLVGQPVHVFGIWIDDAKMPSIKVIPVCAPSSSILSECLQSQYDETSRFFPDLQIRIVFPHSFNFTMGEANHAFSQERVICTMFSVIYVFDFF